MYRIKCIDHSVVRFTNLNWIFTTSTINLLVRKSYDLGFWVYSLEWVTGFISFYIISLIELNRHYWTQLTRELFHLNFRLWVIVLKHNEEIQFLLEYRISDSFEEREKIWATLPNNLFLDDCKKWATFKQRRNSISIPTDRVRQLCKIWSLTELFLCLNHSF